MVLSNKKLKEKLRAAKAELLAEQQVSGGDPNPKTEESLKTILKSVAQKPKLSKREKRREKVQSLLEISASITEVGGESGSGDVKGEKEGGGSEERNKRKRKRGDKDGLESGQEVKTAEKNTKKKKKKKLQKKSKGKKEGNEELKEGVKNGEEGVSQAIQASECKENAEISTKVYVGGIPYYSNEDDIRSFFEGCGTITEVDCMTFPDTGKFRGIAIINFKTEAAAKRALALDGSDMGGLFLKVKPHNSSRVNKVSNFSPAVVEGYNRIYIGNLSWEITEDDLRKLFSDCNITAIRFGEDKETGEFKCYAHVDFGDGLSLNTALKLDQTVVCGRPVRISCAVPKKGAVTNARSTQSDTQAKNVDGGSSKATPQSNRVDTPPQNSPVDTPQSNQVETQTLQSNQADTAAMSALSAKIRRRTCYECGERGHLSSSCPKKQAAEQGNQAAS
ncbi:PREDICTED: nucleolin 1 [Ipomoea nil]|uniref:nucleolin 1 n=1 Tax=Ipomoea nil TaxID=35883 RepID=UPI000901FE85|nr:PREDICTED: nucleolin 1 [Ipomoea nil]